MTSTLEAETSQACVEQEAWIIYINIWHFESLTSSLWVCVHICERMCLCVRVCMCVFGVGSYLVGAEVTQALLFCVTGWQVLLQGDCSGWVTCLSSSLLFRVLTWGLCSEIQDTEFSKAEDTIPAWSYTLARKSLCGSCTKYVSIYTHIISMSMCEDSCAYTHLLRKYYFVLRNI